MRNPLAPTPQELQAKRRKVALELERKYADKDMTIQEDLARKGALEVLVGEWSQADQAQPIPASVVAIESMAQVLGFLLLELEGQKLSPVQFQEAVKNQYSTLIRFREAQHQAVSESMKAIKEKG